jgi:glycosyltransferase 2 family protein
VIAPPVIRQRGVRAGLSAAWRSPGVRALAGLAISGIFLAVTISRVDLRETVDALAGASPVGVVLAVILVVVELVMRSERWRFLLLPVVRVPRPAAFAYLNIGYFANALLPARLGDGARAYLAGRSFGISSLTTLGSIIVERAFDAAAILAIVIATGALVAGGSQIAGSASLLAAAAALGLAVAGLLAIAAVRSGLLQVTHARIVHEMLRRTAEGGRALRDPLGVVVVTLLTLAPFAVGVGTFGAIATALGLGLGPAEWALVLGVLALSTALPAAPGSLGTYEFVGVTALGVLGVPASQALAATVLVHVIATLPPALIGLAATLVMHVRVGELRTAGRSIGLPAEA